MALEKPFGEDRDAAIALNKLLADAFGGCEEAAFRIDHVLGMATLQNLVQLSGASTSQWRSAPWP